MRRSRLISLLAIAGLFVLLTACGQNKFDGIRVAEQDSYRLDAEQMDGTDTHTLALDAGDVLEIHFQTDRGKLYMEIKAPDGTLFYAGNGENVTDFTLRIAKNGTYSVFVKAKNAKGSIRIRRAATGAMGPAQEKMK